MSPLSTDVMKKKKPIGLENDENHCWFNAMLQSLEACSTIQSLFQVYRDNIVQHVQEETILRSFSDFLHNRANETEDLDTLHLMLLAQIQQKMTVVEDDQYNIHDAYNALLDSIEQDLSDLEDAHPWAKNMKLEYLQYLTVSYFHKTLHNNNLVGDEDTKTGKMIIRMPPMNSAFPTSVNTLLFRSNVTVICQEVKYVETFYLMNHPALLLIFWENTRDEWHIEMPLECPLIAHDAKSGSNSEQMYQLKSYVMMRPSQKGGARDRHVACICHGSSANGFTQYEVTDKEVLEVPKARKKEKSNCVVVTIYEAMKLTKDAIRIDQSTAQNVQTAVSLATSGAKDAIRNDQSTAQSVDTAPAVYDLTKHSSEILQSQTEVAHVTLVQEHAVSLVQEQVVSLANSGTNDGWNACGSNKQDQKCFNQGGWDDYVHDPSKQAVSLANSGTNDGWNACDDSTYTKTKEISRLDSYNHAKSDVVVTKENWSQTSLLQKHRSEHCFMDWESFTRYFSLDDPSSTLWMDRKIFAAEQAIAAMKKIENDAKKQLDAEPSDSDGSMVSAVGFSRRDNYYSSSRMPPPDVYNIIKSLPYSLSLDFGFLQQSSKKSYEKTCACPFSKGLKEWRKNMNIEESEECKCPNEFTPHGLFNHLKSKSDYSLWGHKAAHMYFKFLYKTDASNIEPNFGDKKWLDHWKQQAVGRDVSEIQLWKRYHPVNSPPPEEPGSVTLINVPPEELGSVTWINVQSLVSAASALEFDQTYINPLDMESHPVLKKSHDDKVRCLENEIREIVFEIYHSNKCRIIPYGSTVTGLCFWEKSDVDFSFKINSRRRNQWDPERIVKSISSRLLKYPSSFQGVVGLAPPKSATPPVVKGNYIRFNKNPSSNDGSIAFDICPMNDAGEFSTDLLNEYISVDPRVRLVMLSIKCWAMNNSLAGKDRTKTLTSFAWNLLVIFYLQNIDFVPNLQSPPLLQHFRTEYFAFFKDVKRYDKWAMPSHFAKTHVATLVWGFFEFYTMFNFNRNVISIRLGKEPFQKMQRYEFRGPGIVIESPYETVNICASLNDLARKNLLQSIIEAKDKMKSALLPGSDDNIPDVLGASPIIENYQSQTKRIQDSRLVGHTEIINVRNRQSPVCDPEFPEANHQSPIDDHEFQEGNLQSPSGYPDYRSDPWKNKEILVPLQVVEGRETMAELGTAYQPSYSTQKSIHATTDITNAPPIGTEMAGEPLIDESRTPLSDESLHNSNDFFELTGSEWYDTVKGIWSESISVVLKGRNILLSDGGSIMLSSLEKFHLFLPVLSVSPADNTLSPRIKCFINCIFIGVHAVVNTENKEKVQAMIYSLSNGDKRIIVAKDHFGYVLNGDELLPSGANADMVSLKASPVKKIKYVIDLDAKNENLSTEEVDKLLKDYQENKYHVEMPLKRKREDDDSASKPNKKNAKTSPLVNTDFLKQVTKVQGIFEQLPETQSLYSNRSISSSFVLSEKKQKGKPTSENVVNGYKCCHCEKFFQQMSTLYAHYKEYKDGSAQDVSRHKDMIPYLEVFKFFNTGCK